MTSRAPLRIWTAPLLLGTLSAIGLIAALLSDGLGDLLAWLTLGAPLAVVLWYLLPRNQTTLRRRVSHSLSSAKP